MLEVRIIKLHYCPTELMIADAMTKTLAEPTFFKFMQRIMGDQHFHARNVKSGRGGVLEDKNLFDTVQAERTDGMRTVDRKARRGLLRGAHEGRKQPAAGRHAQGKRVASGK